MHHPDPHHHWRNLCAVVAAVLIFTGCTSSGGSTESGSDEGPTSTEAQDGDRAAGGDSAGFVQDMWIYERIAQIGIDGEEVDLTKEIIAWATDHEAAEPVTLGEGLELTRYDALSASMVRGGEVRSDIEMSVGVVSSDVGDALAVLATPTATNSDPIGFGDRIRLDLGFLGDALADGDPLLVDHAFFQAFHRGAITDGADPIELVKASIDSGGARYLGTPEGDQQIYTGELGVVVAGQGGAGTTTGGPRGVRSSIGQDTVTTWAGEMPAKSQPMLDGLQRGIRRCGSRGSFGTACIRRYMKTMEAGSRDSMALIDCNLSPSAENCDVEPEPEPEPEPDLPETTQSTTPPTTPDPRCGAGAGPTPEDIDCPDTPVPGGEGEGGKGGDASPRCLIGCSRVIGEPHLRTFDGTDYSMQGVGEYVVSRTDDLEVQIRTTAFGTSASGISAVAIATDGHEITIAANRLTVDGEDLTGDGINASVSLGGASLSKSGSTVTVVTTAGHRVAVTDTTHWLDLWIDLGDDDFDPVGLLGDFDGDPSNDLRTVEGRLMADPLGFEDLYDVFSESWRVDDDTSLFHYDDGEDTATFTDRDFPAAPLTIDSLPAGDRARAERVCRAAEIIDATAFENCVIDLAVTGDIAAIRSSRQADTIAGILDGRFTANGAVADDDGPTTEPTDVGDDVEAVAIDGWQVASRDIRGTNQRDRLRCPADGSPHRVWGSDIYSDDSSVCTAAVHMGLITFDAGGVVRVEHLAGRDSYLGVERNGVSTIPWDSWEGSFAFVDEEGERLTGR